MPEKPVILRMWSEFVPPFLRLSSPLPSPLSFLPVPSPFNSSFSVLTAQPLADKEVIAFIAPRNRAKFLTVKDLDALYEKARSKRSIADT